MEDIGLGETSLNINPRQSKRFPSRFLILVAVVIVLALIIFGISQLFFAKQSPKKESLVVPTVALTPTNSPEETKGAEVTPTKGTDKTPTPKPGTSALDKTKISIEVQNGSGEPGVASKMSTLLKSLGYTVSGTGNADTFDYANVVIKTKAASSKYLPNLKKELSQTYTVGQTYSNLPDTAAVDIVVIVGK